MARRAVIASTIVLACLTGSPGARAADVLHVANVSRTLFSLPFWVAQRQGFMKDEGLDTTSHILDNAEKINAALRSGADADRDGHARSRDDRRLQGRHAAHHRRQHRPAAALHHHQARDQDAAQLRGANIGILSEKEGSTYVVQDIAKAIGLTPADYTMTAVGGAPTRWRLLKEGKIDAGLQPFPLSYKAEAAGFNNLGSVIPFVPDWQFTTINADREMGGARTATSSCGSCARCSAAAIS